MVPPRGTTPPAGLPTPNQPTTLDRIRRVRSGAIVRQTVWVNDILDLQERRQGSLSPEEQELRERATRAGERDLQTFVETFPPAEREQRPERSLFKQRPEVHRIELRAALRLVRQRGGLCPGSGAPSRKRSQAVIRPERRAHAARPATNARRRRPRRASSGGTPDDEGELADEHSAPACVEPGCTNPLRKPARGPWPERCEPHKLERAAERKRRSRRQRRDNEKRQEFAPWTRGLSLQEIARLEAAFHQREADLWELMCRTGPVTPPRRVAASPQESAGNVGVNAYMNAYGGDWKKPVGNEGAARGRRPSPAIPADCLAAADDWERQRAVYQDRGEEAEAAFMTHRATGEKADARPPRTPRKNCSTEGATAYMGGSRQGAER